MITFVAGTTAEFIKIAPVIRELRRRGMDFQVWATDQHVDGVTEVLEDFDLRVPLAHFVPSTSRRTISRMSQVLPWFFDLARTLWHFRREFRARAARGVVLVHGDTFTTVFGAIAGRMLGCRVGHIEAGLRSGSLVSPFPEEINRRLVARLATDNFCPTAVEAANLRREGADKRSQIVVTGANTVVDALRFASAPAVARADLPRDYALVTLHRFELVQNRVAYTDIVRRVMRLSVQLPVVMMIGQSDRALLEQYGLMTALEESPIFTFDKMRYLEFIRVLVGATLVITDSGGLQEECAALGVPTAVHRTHTERRDGLGENIVLTGMDVKALDDFLAHFEDYRRPSQLDTFHPAAAIAEVLERGR
ncbi:UDP-N-acetylglucosamine 2-epimerase [Mobiluncus porci]|uniref:UDP-N-acetyl glucosamine 2-epimerase n=1 Tax=Mobiluncus porci TaxID=2652278 RepID=A0A7K0K3J8_9ACTO|nr:UDP-N-acetyl glucosamine 2-epimerase [Mobiluncus porci]